MHRFYAAPEDGTGSNLVLTGDEAHHALRVLRVRQGEAVVVLDGRGGELLCEIEECRRDRIQLAVVKKSFLPPQPFQITLLQAVPRGKIIESIIQKATELGTARIVPLLSERTTTRLENESAASKAAKWQRVAIEAAKQCGQRWLPRIDLPATPEEVLGHGVTFDLSLIASLQPGGRHAGEYFRAFRQEQKRPPKSVGIWVGPEGDFTAAETAAIISGGARPITLGPLVLRSETAAICCLSILNHELQSPA